jgi:hypothetical protein
MKRKDSQETDTKTLLTRVNRDLADTFTAVAARRHRSVAAELRRMIEAEVEVDQADAATQQEAA